MLHNLGGIQKIPEINSITLVMERFSQGGVKTMKSCSVTEGGIERAPTCSITKVMEQWGGVERAPTSLHN